MNPIVCQLLDSTRDTGWVMEPIAKRLLSELGLPVTDFRWARTWDEAARGATELGYPVVAKVVSPEVVHKSDVGGVVVGITDERGLRAAWDHMAGLPSFDGVLLDEMVAGGVELIVGAKQDPQFGTVVLTGIGGTSVEIYRDVAIRLAPMGVDDARTALGALTGRALLEGHRGSPPVDLDALVRLMVAFSEAAWTLRAEIESIDLNPVLCTTERAVVADARIMLA